ncbi:MAG: urease accessory UreF family protein [Pseudomonadota bacterium]|nr:urease accessory UreF family protein [Pseudomonadota bacterium]
MTATPAEHLLILQNWFSPAFPVGAFSYSGGLETAIARGAVHDRDSLADWLTVSLLNGTAFTDTVCLRAALAGGEVNDLCLALCAGAERYQETTELGAAFANVMRETQDIDLPEGLAYPVAVGLAARALGLAPHATLAAFLQGFCMNQISVAVRAVPIGQMEGQSCLRSLMPVIERALETVMITSTDEMGSFALAGDLCALEHETARQRIYRT